MLRNLQFALYERSTFPADRVVLVELTKQVPGSVSTVRNPDQPYFVELSSPTTTPTPTPTTWDNM